MAPTYSDPDMPSSEHKNFSLLLRLDAPRQPYEGVGFSLSYREGSEVSLWRPVPTRHRRGSDKEVYKYKIAELTETSNDLDDYAKYIFVIRERVNRRSEEVVLFIDIKSEGLYDILQEVLYDIKAVSLIEDKLSIEQNFLFYFLLELDRYTENINSSLDYKSVYTEYLLLLIDHLNVSNQYYSTVILYMTFFRRFLSLLNLECRFLDYNGVKFGETGIFLYIAKFRGLKPIEALKAFPLYHYLNYEGQKFWNLAGLYVRYYKGSAFFINKGKAIKVNINSRVVVDTVFFYKIQPNYSRPSLRDIGVKDNVRIVVFNISIMLIEDRKREKERMRGDGVDVQKLSEADLLVAYLIYLINVILVECVVSALRDVVWSPKSFDCLKIPLETKTILLLLAKTRLGMIPTVPFDDYIGKASMILRLLNLICTSGLPGVGKTFTVKLKTVFKIAKYFNTVLLLDEADAFIEQRTSYYDTYNRLMTIFLRKLEYY
ncbi:ATPase AAA-type core [Penicillium verrucosum]|uniref:ATPase AAA-type core n=1 Tax=Penicillium verrucosum TaxID=60171 RepID=UPI002544E1FB|nr:ATPase AAA-type core [Penicillium verrucosum]KAJ5944569.1 ATPase AAA-type core [Penicillium verrucosum]